MSPRPTDVLGPSAESEVPSEPRTIEDVLEKWRGYAEGNKATGDTRMANAITDFCSDVETAGHDYFEWLAEDAAVQLSDRSRAWLRARYPRWAAAGHARKKAGRRYYRSIVLPKGTDRP